MNRETKQTAVEWFMEHIHALNIDSKTHYTTTKQVYEQAKEMEKEQKRKDFTDGYMHGNEPLNHDVIDKWYNETYGGNK